MARRHKILSPVWILPIVLLGFPIALLAYESHRTGLPWRDVLERLTRQAGADATAGTVPGGFARGERIGLFESQPIGDAAEQNSSIAHVAIYDLDQDGLNDVLVCDVLQRAVTWIRQSPPGVYTERRLGDQIAAPAHVEAFDMDADGDLDLLVAGMGVILPDNDRIGKAIIMENDGEEHFTTHVIAQRIARVNDLQAGDLDGDGDADLAAAQFGYDQGEIRWMRNLGNWQFQSEILLRLSGTIHTPIADLDNDGDLDIAAVVAQEWEEIYVFENDGTGRFTTHLIHGVDDADYGSSGIGLADLDADGDTDIIWSNGDAFVATDYRPRPSHGLQWLENRGGLAFAYHRLGDFPGAYDPCAADLDGDGDLDVLAVSPFNDWEPPGAQSMMWWENLGEREFLGHDLAEAPTHLLTVDVADMDHDGRIDAVTGSMNLYPPFDRIGRVTLWLNVLE